MLLTEWGEEQYRELLHREAKEDGCSEGYDEGYDEGEADGYTKGEADVRKEFLARAADAVRSGALSVSATATAFGFSKEEINGAL